MGESFQSEINDADIFNIQIKIAESEESLNRHIPSGEKAH
jgi:hypothetical protein